MKSVVFKRTMLQRHRAMIHLIDPLIDRGYKVSIEVQTDVFNLKKISQNPCDASQASKESFKYLIDNFGLDCKNIDSVNFTKQKNKEKGIHLLIDNKKTSGLYVGIPYNSYHCSSGGKVSLVGNPMCEQLRKIQNKENIIKNSLLLIHPGGGRGFVSPVRKDISKNDIIQNNKTLIREFLSYLPSSIDRVTIKTHPIPYLFCDKESLEKLVLTEIRREFKNIQLEVKHNNLFSLMCQHEFLINLGSSTSLWILGSDLKWLNVSGFANYSYKKHREKNERVEGWFSLPQNIQKNQLKESISDYSNFIKCEDKISNIINGYKDIYKMNATKKIINIIEECYEKFNR